MPKLKLPNKPSALILLAIKDIEAIEKMKGFEVQMTNGWLTRISEEDLPKKLQPKRKRAGHLAPCKVCFAGAVMRQRAPKKLLDEQLDYGELELVPDFFDWETKNKLYALDEFRRGNVRTALEKMQIEVRAERLYFLLPPDSNIEPVCYENDPKMFKAQMRTIAALLASVEL